MIDERRYEVLAVLGQGGFGTVYHARFLGEGGFSKEVALKVLNPDMEGVAEIASRLRDEARVLGLIRHRAIVGVDRLTQLDGRWTVVMEYIEGHDLGHLLASGPLPVGVALEIAAEIAGALHAAYTRAGPNGQPLRLLHRDLKPSNVRVTPFGEVKVLDFGIARAEFGEREAKTRSLAFGTPEYMSPERLDFSGDTAAGDVYALGAVLFELITGTRLGRTSANPNKHSQKLVNAAASLQQAGAQPPVIELLGRMLAFEEQARPAAAEVERRAAALARSVGGLSLREWVDGLQPAVPVQVEAVGNMTGSILVERAETPTPGSSGTVWEKVPTPAPGAARPSPSPVRLQPAATALTPAGPSVPPPPVVPVPGPPRPTAPKPAPQAASTTRMAPSLAIGGAAVLLLVVVGVGSGLWWATREEAPPAVAVPQPAVQVTMPSTTAAATTPPAGPATGETAPATNSQAPTTTTTTTTPTTSKTTTASSTSTTAKAPATPTVAVGLSGDATSASLVATKGGKRHRLPNGRIPVGSYEIRAGFDGEPETKLSTVTVEVGQSLSIHCDSQFGKCTVSSGGAYD